MRVLGDRERSSSSSWVAKKGRDPSSVKQTVHARTNDGGGGGVVMAVAALELRTEKKGLLYT